MAAEDYIHRIGRTARSTNTGIAYTFITRENSRHVPQLISVLREANQVVSDQLQNMCRGGFRGSRGGGGSSGGGGGGGYQQSNFYSIRKILGLLKTVVFATCQCRKM
jgi:hypothetical protein